MTDALLWEFDIEPNLRERAYVNSSLSEVCTWYRSVGDAGMFKDTLQACLEEHGVKIWNSMAEWAQNRNGQYDPNAWLELELAVKAHYAEYGNTPQIDASKTIKIMEDNFGFNIDRKYKADFESDINRKCGWHDLDEHRGLSANELISCLEEHGEWIWEELSFYRTLSVHWWALIDQSNFSSVFTDDTYQLIDFTLVDAPQYEISEAQLMS